MHEFRALFRDIMSLMDQRKELIQYIFTSKDPDDSSPSPQRDWPEHESLRNQILFMLTQQQTRKRRAVERKERASHVLEAIRELKLVPISV